MFWVIDVSCQLFHVHNQIPFDLRRRNSAGNYYILLSLRRHLACLDPDMYRFVSIGKAGSQQICYARRVRGFI